MRGQGRFCTHSVVAMIGCLVFARVPDAAGSGLQLRSVSADRDVFVAAGIASPAIDATHHYVLSLAGPLTREHQARLRGAGVSELTYVPENMLIVSGEAAGRVLNAGLEFVTGVAAYRAEWKLDPEIGRRLAAFQQPHRQALAVAGKLKLLVTLFPDADVAVTTEWLIGLGGEPAGLYAVGRQAVMDVVIDPRNAGALLAGNAVQYVEEAPEITLRNSTVRWIVQSNQPALTPLYDEGLHGEGQVVGVLDSEIDANHCAFRDDVNPIGPQHRKLIAYNIAAGAGNHGTLVAGIVAGDNGDDSDTRGVAYAARLVYNRQPALDEMSVGLRLGLHHDQGARIHTNSWGDDGTVAYNSLCRAIDQFCYDNEDDLVLLAVTNLPVLRNPENAKNPLAVGATHDSPNQHNHCSGGAGPTTDARRKPEVFAPGCFVTSARSNTACDVIADGGTSMATPAVAGVAALFRQYFVDGFYPTGSPVLADTLVPSGALLKAMLIDCTSDMTGVSGFPSNREGWGRIVADSVAYFTGDTRRLVVRDIRNATGLSTGQVRNYEVAVGAAAEPLRFTLVWTEPPAAAGAALAQVNNLDLEVVSPGGASFNGNRFSNGFSTPGGAADARNNVEQVHVSVVQPGHWLVRVKGTAVNQGTQGFALVVTGDVAAAQLPLTITLPNGPPPLLTLESAAVFDVEIDAGTQALVPESGRLHHRFADGPFLESPLVATTANRFQATLPAAPDCDAQVQFYVSAQGDGGGARSVPDLSPVGVFTAQVGTYATLFNDTFETDLGWTVQNSTGLSTGAWERGVPTGGGARGDSSGDYDGSGSCYMTQNGAGDLDIDGGETWLLSPRLDLSAGDAELGFAVWFTNHFGTAVNADTFYVRLSNDDGATWSPAYSIGPDSSGVWNPVTLRVSDHVPPTALVRVRFEASDLNDPSVVEAAVDAVRVRQLVCEDPVDPGLLGDMNCDNLVTVSDIGGFVLAVTDPAGYAAAYPACDFLHGDMNDDGAVTVADIGAFVALLTGG